MDILRFPNIRRKFFILAFDWVANAVVYNGLAYNTTNLGVSDYLAFFIGTVLIFILCSDITPSLHTNPWLTCLINCVGGAVEIPSYFVTWYAMDRWGRRSTLCLTMLLGGLACVSCVFVPTGTAWWTVIWICWYHSLPAWYKIVISNKMKSSNLNINLMINVNKLKLCLKSISH